MSGSCGSSDVLCAATGPGLARLQPAAEKDEAIGGA
jgi:hypothetical protein